jgi:hypothetical protein
LADLRSCSDATDPASLAMQGPFGAMAVTSARVFDVLAAQRGHVVVQRVAGQVEADGLMFLPSRSTGSQSSRKGRRGSGMSAPLSPNSET